MKGDDRNTMGRNTHVGVCRLQRQVPAVWQRRAFERLESHCRDCPVGHYVRSHVGG